VEIERRIRWYQRPFHEYLINTPSARAIEIAHRRWGKDEIVLSAFCEMAHRRIGSYWHCLPEYNQGRKAIWTAVNANTGKRRIDEAFPGEVRENTNETEMFIRLKCGSTWQVIGSDRYDATVGAGPVAIAYSEWALSNPSAWAYHRPMLEENGGTAAFITTPRGRNHAYNMYQMARDNPRWFAEVSTVHDTGALSPEQLDESLKEYVALYGEDIGRAQFAQEYECSFNAAILGAFYAREMALVRKEGRIAEIEPDTTRPVHRAWDIGVRDDTSIWWFQVVGMQVFVLDCYTQSGVGLDHYAEIIEQRRKTHGWEDGNDFVPHDAKVKEWGTGRTRVETMQKYGFEPAVVPMASKLDGVNAARRTLARCVFHPRCEEVGIAAFRADAVHDWTSHLADAFRYMSLAWQDLPKPKTEKPQHVFSTIEDGYVIAPALPKRRRA
jgi:phage terminase large subunit